MSISTKMSQMSDLCCLRKPRMLETEQRPNHLPQLPPKGQKVTTEMSIQGTLLHACHNACN